MTYDEIKTAVDAQLLAAMKRIKASGEPNEGDTQDFTVGGDTITFRCTRFQNGPTDFLTFVWRQGDNQISFGKWHC